MNKPWTLVAALVIMPGIAYFTSTTTLEIVATTTGLLSVWLTAREKIWAWPIGLVNVACFFYMFYEVKLYADMTLQVFFFILSIYGWVIWLTKRNGAEVRPTRRISPRLAGILLVALFAGTGIWGYVLATYTDASIPYPDAFIAMLSLIAQMLLSYKILENWYCWIVVDVLSVGMYLYKDLNMLAFLYVIFLCIAISGLITWKKQQEVATWESAGLD
ncbi:nicotinamide riboside transporter PnuC [Paenibacillus harenae]|uniref:Nicotinamide mononucleotide transporter n=1 Tax=Paenibacillus harenae TaxID=306543 RepID=A0ABT9U897_PAEHA|nr:nicotinamide riboside transporter PnuC [Paenibacillus harenae]MDQ0115803.1 nicotinamide mononucleotide transporter [Paenibacillus harenae]